MKIIYAVLLFLSSLTTASAENQVQCSSGISSVVIYISDKTVIFKLEDRIGFRNFPIFSGVLTPMLLDSAQSALKDLKDIDGELTVSWPKENCHWSKSFVDCAGRGEVQGMGSRFKKDEKSILWSSGLSTETIHHERMNLSYDKFSVHLNLSAKSDSEGIQNYFVEFPFARENCRLNLSR